MTAQITSLRILKVLVAGAVLIGLYLASLYSYLLFHSIAELFYIIIAGATFVLVWNFRPFFKDSFLVFIGTAFLFCGLIDLVHTLAYMGMNVFIGFDANLPTQLWIAARYLQSIALLIAPVLIGRKVHEGRVVAVFAGLTALLLASILLWDVFPEAFIEGEGLTSFKIVSEYIIVAILLLSVAHLWTKRAQLEPRTLWLLSLSALMAVFGELAFTSYISVYGFANLLGHFFRIISVYLFYKAIVETAAQKIYTDVDKLVRTENELRLSQKSERERIVALEALMDAVPAVVWVAYDPNCSYVVGNRASTELLRLPPGANQSKTPADGNVPQHFRVYKDGRELAPEELPLQISAREGIEIQGFEEQIVFDSGVVRHMYGNVTPLLDSNGQPAGAVAAFIDISSRLHAEAELEKYARRLERSNKDLEQFAFVASHDMQEPLRKVRAFGERLQVMMGDRLEEDERDYLNRIMNASVRMQAMIDGLLAYSRVSTHGRPFEPVDLNEVVAEVISDLELRIERSQAQVIVKALPQLQADPLQMRQLFLNLIGNALKFHRAEVAPVVKIWADPAARGPGGLQTVIHVRDNGIGFDAADSERIFRPFERLHSRSQYEGAGIGLAICQKIAERHGGSIHVDSAPGQGAHFSVVLFMDPDPLADDRSSLPAVSAA